MEAMNVVLINMDWNGAPVRGCGSSQKPACQRRHPVRFPAARRRGQTRPDRRVVGAAAALASALLGPVPGRCPVAATASERAIARRQFVALAVNASAPDATRTHHLPRTLRGNSGRPVLHDKGVNLTSFRSPDGAVYVTLGPASRGFNELLADAIMPLPPVGSDEPSLSTYWIDRAISEIQRRQESGAGGAVYSLPRARRA